MNVARDEDIVHDREQRRAVDHVHQQAERGIQPLVRWERLHHAQSEHGHDRHDEHGHDEVVHDVDLDAREDGAAVNFAAQQYNKARSYEARAPIEALSASLRWPVAIATAPILCASSRGL
jgi:hypothetical protein